MFHVSFTTYEQVNVCLDLYNMTENNTQLPQPTWNKPLALTTFPDIYSTASKGPNDHHVKLNLLLIYLTSKE